MSALLVVMVAVSVVLIGAVLVFVGSTVRADNRLNRRRAEAWQASQRVARRLPAAALTAAADRQAQR